MTQIDNWKESFEKNYIFLHDYFCTVGEPCPIQCNFSKLVNFIEKVETLAKAEGVKEEHDRWASQTANQHDEKIRAEERKRVVEEIEKMLPKEREDYVLFNQYLEDTGIGFNACLDEVKELISKIK